LLFALILAAPSLSAQESSAAARTRPSVASPPAPSTPPPSPALTSVLKDLDRITSATEADISNMDGGEESDRNWKNAWRFWHPVGSFRSSEDEDAAASLQRNLHDAMPGLIQNARTSGSFAATFRLYHNLSVVCELLDTLVKSLGSQDGESDTPLANDAAAMGRVRQDLATYVEQAAVAMDTRNQYAPKTSTPTTTTSTPTTKPPTKIVVDDTIPVKKIVVDDTVPVKKIIVDDTVPVKRSAKKTGATAPQ
jgi:hypothetical protein